MDTRRTVLFDFDGVIADSFRACHRTARSFCKYNTEEEYRKHFEGNSWNKYKVLDKEDHEGCDHDLDWWKTFKSFFSQDDGLFPQMDKVVQKIAREHRLVIVSSSIHSIIESFCKAHGIDECFDSIYDAEMHKSKSEKIGMIFERYGITAADCVMITDSKGDILEAREKGVESIAVTWGFNTKEVLVSGEPWRIVELPDELPSAVTEFYHGKGTAA